MVLDIVQYGHPVLRKKCREILEVNEQIRELAQNMVETMVAAEGIGLAAPQVAIDLQLAVVDVSHDPECISYLRVDGEEVSLVDLMPLVFMNPTLEYGETKEPMVEGCLSIDEVRAKVKRPTDLKASLELLDGRRVLIETDGLLARAIQHEVDHLNGILFIDRLSPVGKSSVKRQIKRLTGR